MIADDILADRRQALIEVIQHSLHEAAAHSAAFAYRVLRENYSTEFGEQFEQGVCDADAAYAGYPQVACTGYMLGSGITTSVENVNNFLSGIKRLMSRGQAGLGQFSVDDIAILGIVDGLVKAQSFVEPSEFEQLKRWLIEIIDKPPPVVLWTSKARGLAGDLLDKRGRLREAPRNNDIGSTALGIVLEVTWHPQLFAIDEEANTTEKLVSQLTSLISSPMRDEEDVEKAAVWLRAIDRLVELALRKRFSQKDTDAINLLAEIKVKLDREAQRQARLCLITYFCFFATVQVVLFWLIYKLSWNVMEQWTYIVDGTVLVLSYGYFAITLQEFSPKAIYERAIERNKTKLYRRFSFHLDKYEQIKE